MAQFDKVTYSQYSDVLGRAVVPNEAAFNALKLENVQLMKSWLPFVTEKDTDGIDNAVCMMIEAQYKDDLVLSGEAAGSLASESVNGHSVSYGTAKSKLEELNARTTLDRKLYNAKLFVDINIGVR